MPWTVEQVRAAVRGRVPVAPAKVGYRAGLVAVAALMVLLPVLYLAIVVAVGVGLVWWVQDPFRMWHSKLDWRICAIVYVGPLMGGVLLLGALLRAAFKANTEMPEGRALRPGEEPGLRALVDAVADAVGAPRPAEVRVDLDVNASASFRRGWRSLIGGRDLVLTIGLPLAAGLSARQLCGVVAHEFGHFRQGAGMRCGYLIRSVNGWFARATFGPSGFGDTLGAATRSGAILLIGAAGVGTAFVWVARKILHGILFVGHAASCRLSREMEYDADRAMIHVAGSGVVAPIARRLVELSHAERAALADTADSWQEQRLPDDHCALVRGISSQFGEDVQRAIDRQHEEGRTHWWDTHPCDRDRVAAALREPAPGFVDLDGPASSLFADLPALSRELTDARFRAWLGDEARRASRTPSLEMLSDRAHRETAARAVARCFGGEFTWDSARLPTFDPAAPAPGPAAARDAIGRGRRLAGAEAVARRAEEEKRLGEAEEELARLRVALLLSDAGFVLQPKALGLTSVDRGTLASLSATAAAEVALSKSRLGPDAEGHAQRLEAALGLLRAPEIRALTDRGEERLARLVALAPVLSALGRTREAFDIGIDVGVLAQCFGAVDDSEPARNLRSALQSLAVELRARLGRAESALAVAYPYEHGARKATVRDHLLGGAPSSIVFPEWIAWVAGAHRRCRGLEYRVLAEVVASAEAVETALGLPMLPTPGGEAPGPVHVAPRPLHR